MDSITINDKRIETENNSLSEYEWTWDEKQSTPTVLIIGNNKETIKFHPVYSIGTAVAKGNKLLERGRHHFWEIMILTRLYGTDIIVGVGTAKAKINNASNTFCSLIGEDEESWGFSYRGYKQHNGQKYKYGTCFDIGNLVGVHLDTWSGTLEFFLNRKSLGVAFKIPNNVMVYPLISNTMAQCYMRLICTCSVPITLQTTCLAYLTPQQRICLSKKFPGLRYLFQNIFADILQKYDYDNEEDIKFIVKFNTSQVLELINFDKKEKERAVHENDEFTVKN